MLKGDRARSGQPISEKNLSLSLSPAVNCTKRKFASFSRFRKHAPIWPAIFPQSETKAVPTELFRLRGSRLTPVFGYICTIPLPLIPSPGELTFTWSSGKSSAVISRIADNRGCGFFFFFFSSLLRRDKRRHVCAVSRTGIRKH